MISKSITTSVAVKALFRLVCRLDSCTRGQLTHFSSAFELDKYVMEVDLKLYSPVCPIEMISC